MPTIARLQWVGINRSAYSWAKKPGDLYLPSCTIRWKLQCSRSIFQLPIPKALRGKCWTSGPALMTTLLTLEIKPSECYFTSSDLKVFTKLIACSQTLVHNDAGTILRVARHERLTAPSNCQSQSIFRSNLSRKNVCWRKLVIECAHRCEYTFSYNGRLRPSHHYNFLEIKARLGYSRKPISDFTRPLRQPHKALSFPRTKVYPATPLIYNSCISSHPEEALGKVQKLVKLVKRLLHIPYKAAFWSSTTVPWNPGTYIAALEPLWVRAANTLHWCF